MKKFVRTRGAQSPQRLPNGHAPAHTNGHANGTGGAALAGHRDDQHSTLSRHWSGSEGSGKAGGGGGGGGSSKGSRAQPLWEDPEFPATWRALGDRRRAAGVVWKRPHELCPRPTFLGDESVERAPDDPDVTAAHFDEEFAARWRVADGAAGSGEAADAALRGAAAALALTPRLLARVAPPHSFRARYSGAFRFNFWIFGAWREVVVDDRLPTCSGRLLGSAPAHHTDFTLPLLEKAYAKLYGSYRALRGGSTARALQDLTGGVVQSFSLRQQPRALTFQVLNSAVPRSTLLVATGGASSAASAAVTGLARVRGAAPADGALVRLRAVGGAAPAPRSARACHALPAADRDLLEQRADHPDDYWLSFPEFTRSFSQLELVHVGPDDWMSEPALRSRRPWRAVLARRRWRRGYNAGGPPSCRETTGTNPQFHVQIPHAEAGGARKCHVVVSVTQQYAAAAPQRLHAIGFAVYELPAGAAAAPRRAGRAALHALRALDVTHESRAREVVTFFTLPPGQYLVVPHTRRPHTDAAFLLRILTDHHADVWEVNEDNMIIRNISEEFLDNEEAIPAELRASVYKLLGKRDVEEVDAAVVRAALRAALAARASPALCGALVALRDAGASGRMRAADLPALLAQVAAWRAAWAALAAPARARCGRALSSYRLRALLYAAGLTASNKVLECLVLRYAPRARLSADASLLALARLHLAHQRHRALRRRLRDHALSLEEMILMTIYT